MTSLGFLTLLSTPAFSRLGRCAGVAIRWPGHMIGGTAVKLNRPQLRTEVSNTESKSKQDEKSAVTVAAAGPRVVE